MEFFAFFRHLLIILIAVSLYWPLNVPLAALAYKVRLGTEPVPLPVVTFWVRSAAAALGMAVLSASLMGSDQFFTHIGFPAGPVHLVMFLVYVPLGALWMYKVFQLEDGWEGLSTLLLFVFMPGLLLVLIRLAFGAYPPHFVDIGSWINPVPE